jgi:hypothetical protein
MTERIPNNQKTSGDIVDDAPSALTPSLEEQTLRILQGKCPHNKGWTDMGHSHNSNAYECKLCSEMRFW